MQRSVAFGRIADMLRQAANDAIDPRHFATVNCRIAKGSFA